MRRRKNGNPCDRDFTKYGRTANQDVFMCVLLTALACFFCWFFIGRFGIFGSKVDWISQHSVIPDYFRQQFYSTGDFFPEFTANLGGGQNIYHYAYYGLYSPVILLSYLLPFVKMSDYLMAASVFMVALTAVIFFCWLRSRRFSYGISFCTSLMILLAGPVIFHSARHIMFVNYMPFLCLALWGVDLYADGSCRTGNIRIFTGNPLLLTVSVFLMILTSFYFSIGGLLAVSIYGLHRYFARREEIAALLSGRASEICCLKRKNPAQKRTNLIGAAGLDGLSEWIGRMFRAVLGFCADAVRFLRPVMTAILMSAFLLVPAAAALTGKRDGGQAMRAASLFMPEFSAFRLFYHSYGIGLTVFAAVVLIAGLTWRKWSERVLAGGCIAVLVFPFFAWILNGGLYPRDKALIPFLPLICYITACYYRKLEDRTEPLPGSHKNCRKIPLPGDSRMELSVKEPGGIGTWQSVKGALPYCTVILLLFWQSTYGWTELAQALMKLPEKLLEGDLLGGVYQWVLLLLDAVLMLVCYVIFCRWKTIRFLMAAPVLFLMVFGISFHGTANIEDREFYAEVTDENIGTAIETVLSGEDGLYRTEQRGTYRENMANVNRIWSTKQYISSIYSSAYHEGYRDFCTDTFGIEEPTRNFLIQQASGNPVFRKLMGVKYLAVPERSVTQEQKAYLAASGYEPFYEEGGVTVYRRDNVLPMAYMPEQTISQADYETLEFPYNQAALNYFAVVEGKGSYEKDCRDFLQQRLRKAELWITEEEDGEGSGSTSGSDEAGPGSRTGNAGGELGGSDGCSPEENRNMIWKTENGYEIRTEKALEIEAEITESIKLPGAGENMSRILYLQFEVENAHPAREITITAGGIRNKLSSSAHLYRNENTIFTYAIPVPAGRKTVEIEFGAGRYAVKNLQCYLEQQESEVPNLQAEFIPDAQKTQGDRICGTITNKESGYVVTSIPYDSHFEITVDGKAVIYTRVNTAFLGFVIAPGTHEIEIIYHAPGAAAGRLAAAAGWLLFVIQAGLVILHITEIERDIADIVL